VPGLNQYLTGKFQSHSWSGYFELGYRQKIDKIELSPFAGVRFGAMSMNSFSETTTQGLPSELGLAYAGRGIDSVPTLLGVQLRTKTELAPGVVLSALLRTAWQHEFKRERSNESMFNSAPGFNFVIQGAQPPPNSWRTSVGANLTVSQNVSLYGSFDCDYSGIGHAYAGTGGVRVSW